jgi:serine/threonine protein kinase
MELAVKVTGREASPEEERRGLRKRLATFLRQILLSPLAALRLSRGKRLLIVIISYGLAVPGIWFFFPIVHNGASMLLSITSASFLFRYRGLFIALVLNAVAIWLVYHFLLPDIVSGQVFVVRVALGSAIELVFGLVICGLRTVVDLTYTVRSQAQVSRPEQRQSENRVSTPTYEHQEKMHELQAPFPLHESPELHTSVEGESLRDERVGQQFGNYRVVQLLGKGGFAKVYLGQHLYVEKHMVAIKVLRSELSNKYKADFLQEAQRSLGLRHPHIVRFVDLGVKEDTPFLIMEYLSHGTMRTRHPKGSRVPIETVVSYVKQIANALQYIHENNLVHRDVKPENILLGIREELLLSDFGIMAVAHSTGSLVEQGFAGTVAYMAPEQIQKRPRRESDQYALGITVYEWLCGTHPFEKVETPSYVDANLKMQYHHLHTPPPALRDQHSAIPSRIESVVLKALAKDPKDRWTSVQSFATALEQASRQTPTSPITSPLRPVSLLPLEQPVPLGKGTIPTDHAATEDDSPSTN